MSSPFDTSIEINEDAYFTANEFSDCWFRAIARMAIFLNVAHKGVDKVYSRLLKKNDRDLVIYVRNEGLKTLYALEANHLGGTYFDDSEIASNFFYGFFDLTRVNNGLRIRHAATNKFFKECYGSMHPPTDYDGKFYTELNNGKIDKEFMMSAATIYLLRNFYHNYVHNFCQGITHENYRRFSGAARETSDFDADTMSLILLVKSYGLPIYIDRIDKALPIETIVKLLKTARCNSIFRGRSRARKEDETEGDLEWRKCRTIAGYISGYLLAQGLTVCDVRVRISNIEDNTYLIRLNGSWFIVSSIYPLKGSPDSVDAFLKDMATSVCANYKAKLIANKKIKSFSKRLLNAQFSQLGEGIRVND